MDDECNNVFLSNTQQRCSTIERGGEGGSRSGHGSGEAVRTAYYYAVVVVVVHAWLAGWLLVPAGKLPSNMVSDARTTGCCCRENTMGLARCRDELTCVGRPPEVTWLTDTVGFSSAYLRHVGVVRRACAC